MPLPRRSPRSTPRASTTVVPRSLQQARQTISDQQQAITTLQANMAALITRGNVAPAPRVPLSAAPEKCDLDMTPAAFRSSKRPHGTASANAVSVSVTTAGANVSRQPTIEVTVALGKGAKHRTAAVADTGAQVCVAGAALLSSLNIQPTQLQGRAGLRDVADLPLRYPALRSPTTDTDADLDEDLTEAVAAVVIATAEHEVNPIARTANPAPTNPAGRSTNHDSDDTRTSLNPHPTSATPRTQEAASLKCSTPKKAARNLLEDSSSDERSPKRATRSLQPSWQEDNATEADWAPLDLSVFSDVVQQQQQDGGEEQGWTTVTTSRARRHQPPRPKFKLGSLGEYENSYRAISALEREYPTLRIQSETRLVPLTTRVQQITACRVAGVLQRDAEGVTQRRLRLAGTQGAESLRRNPWLLQCTLATHNLARMENWPQADLPAPHLPRPTPWEPPAAEFSATQLPASKALCAVEEMRQHAFMAMAQVTGPDGVVYYTDGSADPDSGRTGAAAITRGAEVCERTPDHCSTLQTELVAILLALEHAQHRRERTVVLHTDSRTGLQALQQPYPSDNVGLVTAILGSLQSLAAQGAAVACTDPEELRRRGYTAVCLPRTLRRWSTAAGGGGGGY
ncbi:hypothetical protein O3P69_009998 [Scylla paramamosain]|uniref:RNase H type-1 domain-containing protein n=1 Tax=Scylla paramamosain TaxID=85552 RepID=A0AAW0SPN7_SCYPA